MNLLGKYLFANKIMSIIAIYFSISIILNIGFSIDILIPCLWKTFLHIECPGCGLTRSFIDILHCNILSAHNENPLIFIVLPLGITYLYFDFIKFKRKIKCTYTQQRL